MVVSVSDDPVRIAQFWQAVEIFSPQTLPKLDPRQPTVDIRNQAPMPWEAGGRLPKPKDKHVWRHQVYGGLYDLSGVRDALVEGLGTEQDEDPRPKGKSALFACMVDEKGFLVSGTMVVSACAWGVGRVGRGQSVIGDFAADTERYANSLATRARVRAGVRVLGEAVRNAVPGGVAAAVNAALGDENKDDKNKDDKNKDDENKKEIQAVSLDTAAITGTDLRDFVSWLADQLGVTDSLRPENVRVQSRQVKISRKDEDKPEPFLNSFLYADLARVAEALGRGDAGPALTGYLTPDARIDARRRTNVRDRPEHALAWCRPHRIPPGRWVTDTDRPLAFSQQFAVNRIMAEHGDGQPGVFAVNGPPGTGKTTMLRDLIAAIVVRRAEKLAGLATPAAAFAGQPHEWRTETYTHRITELKPELTGDEIVVASSNNAAVENVTSEIPGRNGIGGQWRERAAAVDYFAATACKVTGDDAWALVAAIGGNAGNRRRFVNDFWFGNDPDGERTGDGLLDLLRNPAQVPSWPAAVGAFRQSLRKVNKLSSERSSVSAHVSTLPASRAEYDRAAAALREMTAKHEELAAERGSVARACDTAAARQTSAQADFDAHKAARPGLFARGSTKRAWKDERRRLAGELGAAAKDAKTRWDALAALDDEIERVRAAGRAAEAAFAKADKDVRHAENAIETARERWGDRLPDGPEYGATDDEELIARRELSAPWADEEFGRARTELFLAALALHKAFILNAGRPLRANLNAVTDMLSGKGRPKDPAAVLAAWRTLFLVVPVVSTTFASFGPMFAGLGRESLGWLLIDEAGQAAPQNAAGALWRSRRAVVVGDPLQVEPVVTLPWGGQRALLDQFEVSDEWAPSRSSVQRLADRLAADGTLLPGPGADDVWVGAPLRVHRRCDRPMFKVSNAIAYHGLMVFGTPPGRDPFYGRNAWIDVPSGGVAVGNWNPAEGRVLRDVLARLHRLGGVPASEIRVISPYRRVAEEARKIHAEIFPRVSADERENWVATVHKMQGREADAVILVLGGDPGKPGSRRFATQAPNLLNVAVTRARRRLYVIGDHETWSKERFFAELKDPEVLRYYTPNGNQAP